MALLAIVTKAAYDALPEGLKKEYKDTGDGAHFALDVTPVEITRAGKREYYGLEDVHGLKSGLQKERADAEELRKIAKNFEGMDAKEAKEAIARLKALGENPAADEKVKAQIDSITKQLSDKHKTELDALRKTESELEGELSKLLVDQAALNALSKHKLVDGATQLLMPHIKSGVRIVKGENGKRAVRVVDPITGQDRVSLKTGNNGFMDLDEFVESMSKDKTFAVAFAGSGASGTGGKPKKGEKKQQAKQDSDAEEGSDPRGKGIHRATQNPAQRLIDAREQMETSEA